MPAQADEVPPFTFLNETHQNTLQSDQTLQPDSNTGAYRFTYSTTIPAGRFGLQPNLDLHYNNQDQSQDGIFGLGWSMDFPVIRRLNKTGVDNLYTDHYFTSSFSGELVPISLTDDVHGTYGARIETGDFLIYTFRAEGYWTVTDKRGTEYTFGDTNDSVQNDPADSTRVFAWMVRRVQDTNHNFVRYEYTKENGQVYPAKINYTGNGENDGSFSVYFTLESRPDVVTSYDTGFHVQTTRRVSQIAVRENEGDIHHFDFAYTTGHNGVRSLLASVIETGYAADGTVTALPPETFTYSGAEKTWIEDTDYSLPTYFKTYNSRYDNVRQADVNGDGLVDLIQAYEQKSGYDPVQYFTHVFLNKGDGTGWEESLWSFPEHCVSGCFPVRYVFHDGRDDPSPEVITDPYAQAPVTFNDYSGNDTGARLVDVNGDGLTDLLESYRVEVDEQYYYPRFEGAAWEEWGCTDDPLTSPQCYTEEYGSHEEDISAVYINTGSGWMEDANYIVPVFAIDLSTHRDQGVRFADVNGDGLTDLLQGRDNYYGNGEQAVYLNKGDGTGWQMDLSFFLPVTFTLDGGSKDSGARLGDVNGDGLPDIIRVETGFGDERDGSTVYLNKGDGTGWVEDANYSIPIMYHPDWAQDGWETKMGFGYQDFGLRLMDVNADGLQDLMLAKQDQQYCGEPKYQEGNCASVLVSTVFLNTGNNFVEDNSYTLPTITDDEYLEANEGPYYYDEQHPFDTMLFFADQYTADQGVRIADVNGDGTTDFMLSYDGGYGYAMKEYQLQSVYTHDASVPDLLDTITSPQGSITSITYQASAVYKDEVLGLANPALPYTVQTVRLVQTDDGFGNLSSTTYEYKDGRMYYEYPLEKTFAGFGEVKITNDSGFVTKQYYHQGNETNAILGEYEDHVSKIGKKYREEKYNDAEHVMQTVVQRWERSDLGYGNYFSRNTITTQLDYDGNDDHKDRALEWTYDTTNGNLLQRITRGEVLANSDGTYSDTGQDAYTTSFDYATSADGLLRGYVSKEWMKDQSNKTMRETRIYYDNNDYGAVTVGNKTKEERLISGVQYATTSYTYMAEIGLMDSLTDPNGNKTLYWYDNYVLYPTSITDPLGYVTLYSYDFSAGQPTSVTDPNGGIVQKTYDGLDRVVKEEQSSAGDPATLVTTKTLAYDDVQFPRSIHESQWLDASTSQERFTYYDGLGRPVQQRVELDDAGQFSVTDQYYNELGLVNQVSLAYASLGTSYTTPADNILLYESYLYDPLQRETERRNAVGTTQTSYDNWKKTVVDPNGHIKEYQEDAYQRLIGVNEYLAGASYSTTYSYDANNNLTKLTDANGNNRKFTYDLLNRQLTAQDLHSPMDTQFSTWHYQYDAVGNKKSITDGNGTTSTYRYDALNRIISENDPTTPGIDIAYAYDSCQYGIGRLCSANVQDTVKTEYAYTPLGDQASEQRTVDDTLYVTSFAYDRQHHLSEMTYPDGGTAQYQSNSAGKISTVLFADIDGTTTPIAADITYAPSSKPIALTLGNGAMMNWEYHAEQLYRLARKHTTIAGETVQDFSYQYDANGNIVSIDDQSSAYHPMQLLYTYDNLDRLVSAQGESADPALAYIEAYTYDAIGNITETSANEAYQYQSRRAGNYANPQAVTKVGSTVYAYDKNGNLTSKGRWTHTWNFKNQLTGSTNGQVSMNYGYDHTGARVLKADLDGPIITTTINPYYDVEDHLVRRHIRLDDLSLGGIATSTHDTDVNTTQLIYHTTDHLGGTHIELNETGSVEEYVLYKPYGSTLAQEQTGDYDNPYKFTGKPLDHETGLYYFNARYYDPLIGRFVSQDPMIAKTMEGGKESTQSSWNDHLIKPLTDWRSVVLLDQETNKKNIAMYNNPQRLNSYSYALNSPLNYIDPRGLEATKSLTDIVINTTFHAIEATVGAAEYIAGTILVLETADLYVVGQIQRLTTGDNFGLHLAAGVYENGRDLQSEGRDLFSDAFNGFVEDTSDAWDWGWSDDKTYVNGETFDASGSF